MTPRADRALTITTAVLVAGLAFLPLANWIPGGPSIPGWRDLLDGWWSGTALTVGIAAVLAIVSRRLGWSGRRFLDAAVRTWTARPGAADLALALAAGILYAVVARLVLSGRPLLIDEIVQAYQARILADGRLFIPAPEHAEFFSSSLVLRLGDKVFGQFPIGGPAMLALGTLLGAAWLTGPLFGAVSVWLFARLSRRLGLTGGVALAATLVFGFAPFAVFLSGSHMNHVTALTWILAGLLGLVRLTGAEPGRLRAGLQTGLGFGIAATIRPVDAFAFALPAGVWLLGRTVARRGGVGALLAAGIGILIPLSVQLAVNAATTGDPRLFGYTALWGPSHDLGFHATPWGEVHTPARGLELLNLYFVRLQSYFLEWPVPSLLPLIAALLLVPRLSGFDRYLLAASALLVTLYFAYWHDGFYLGPRFMLPLLPWLALWTARAGPLIAGVVTRDLPRRTLALLPLTATAVALVASVPIRVREYRQGMTTMRWDADRAAANAGVGRALVLVRESWGAQLVARMWAVGLTPSQAEHIYRKTDACALEGALDRIETERMTGEAAAARLLPLLADSARLVTNPYTTDPTSRLLPGSGWTAECIERLKDDRAGFTLYPPLLLAGRGRDIVYARDLHQRDSLLLRQYPDRAVYLLRPRSDSVGAPPEFIPLRRDSLLAAWRAEP